MNNYQRINTVAQKTAIILTKNGISAIFDTIRLFRTFERLVFIKLTNDLLDRKAF